MTKPHKMRLNHLCKDPKQPTLSLHLHLKLSLLRPNLLQQHQLLRLHQHQLLKKVVTIRVHRAVFPGSFDPIHRGHVEPVRSAAEHLGIQRVLVLPTGRPPHKSKRDFAPVLLRYAMVELALVDEPRFREMTAGSLESPASSPLAKAMPPSRL